MHEGMHTKQHTPYGKSFACREHDHPFLSQDNQQPVAQPTKLAFDSRD